MNEDYIMHAGDRFASRECGCSMLVTSGPADVTMASSWPKCCCGHDMIKEPTFAGGDDGQVDELLDSRKAVLPGMLA